MFTIPIPEGYEEDVRFTLFSALFLTSKETYNVISDSQLVGNVHWGGNFEELDNSVAFNRDLVIRGHTDGDERYMRQRLYLLGIDDYNYLEVLFHIVNHGRVQCPDEIRVVRDLGFPVSIIHCIEYY